MKAIDVDLSKYFCCVKYFEKGNHCTPNPGEKEILHALTQVQSEIDDVTRTVEILRMPNDDSVVNKYRMQFQGEKDKFLILLMKDSEIFATPAFDIILGKRGTIEVIGDEWGSNQICTEFSIVQSIAFSFCCNGKLAFPEIWTIWGDQ